MIFHRNRIGATPKCIGIGHTLNGEDLLVRNNSRIRITVYNRIHSVVFLDIPLSLRLINRRFETCRGYQLIGSGTLIVSDSVLSALIALARALQEVYACTCSDRRRSSLRYGNNRSGSLSRLSRAGLQVRYGQGFRLDHAGIYDTYVRNGGHRTCVHGRSGSGIHSQSIVLQVDREIEFLEISVTQCMQATSVIGGVSRKLSPIYTGSTGYHILQCIDT